MEEIITIEQKVKRKKAPFIIGVIILVFAIIGVVNIVGFVKDAVKPQDDESAQLQEYAQFLTWVVGVDPASFSDITSANKDDLRNIAICSLMNDGITTSTYTVSEKGLTVPASDVELYYYSMFGQDTSIVHANVVGYGYEFAYDAANGVYYVPLTGVTPPFSVRVESAKVTGDFIQLRVGYVGTSNVEIDAQGNLKSAQPDKYADVTLKKTENGYNLISLMAVTVGEYN
ncbi:MAG: hypothetical protein IIX14_04900 [Clostridia bacterium]|jgi:hypothetical protein|nr:hypothetical protein [Clostridia bacterium]